MGRQQEGKEIEMEEKKGKKIEEQSLSVARNIAVT